MYDKIHYNKKKKTIKKKTYLNIWKKKKVYWSRLPFPSPGDLPNPGIEPRSPVLQADSLPSEPPLKLTPLKIFSKQNNMLCFSYEMNKA